MMNDLWRSLSGKHDLDSEAPRAVECPCPSCKNAGGASLHRARECC